MRLSSTFVVAVLATCTAASPIARRGDYNDPQAAVPESVYPGFPGFPGGHGGHGGPGFPGGPGGPGNGGPGNGGPGNGGPGNGGPGNGGPGNGGPGNGGPGNGGPGNGGPGNGGPGNGGPGNGGPGNGGPGNGGPGNGGPGNGGPGNGGPGNGGPGNGGPGNGGPGNGGPGNGGGVGNPANCGVSAGQISALTPLLTRLGLDTTVDGVKKLVVHLTDAVGDLVNSPAINGPEGVSGVVNNLVNGLLGSPLDLSNTLTAVSSILHNQVPCLLDTLLPKP